MLHEDDTVVALVEAMLDVPAAVGEFAHIPSLEVGAGRQDDIGKLGLTFKPDGLVHHKFQVVGPVRPHVAVGLAMVPDMGAAVFVVHLDGGVTGRRIFEPEELAFNGRGIGGIPVGVAVQDRLRDAQPGHLSGRPY